MAALLVSFVVTLLCERIARRTGLLAHPREDRWHRGSVPMLGGIGIMLSVLVLGAGTARDLARFGPLLLLALAMGGVGLVDDVKTLRPHTKLAAQIVGAAALIGLGTVLPLTPFPPINLFLTLFWVVGITNAFNLLDNMDGLAGGVAALTACFRLALFLIDGDRAGAFMMAALCGATGGFLIRNVPPAKIFMGDAGSLFLGFFLSGVSLVSDAAYTRGVAAVLVFPVLIVVVPILDTAFVTVTRLLTGRSVAQGGRDHTSHRLVALGMSERQALLVLLGISTVSGVLAVLSYRHGFQYSIILVVLLVVGLTLLVVHLGRAHVTVAVASTGGPAIRRLANFPYKRQVATLAIDAVLIVLAYYAAYLLRFEDAFERERATFLRSVGPLVGLQVLALAVSGTYGSRWRYTDVSDMLRLVRAATLAVGGSVLYFFLGTTRFEGLSRAVFVLDWIFLILLLAGSRLAYRLLGERLRPRPMAGRRVLIYGAGDGGALTLRELRNNAGLGRHAIGFLDDDRDKRGTRIGGLPVLGGLESAETLLVAQRVAEVIIASPNIAPERVRRLEQLCAPRGVAVTRASLWIG